MTDKGMVNIWTQLFFPAWYTPPPPTLPPITTVENGIEMSINQLCNDPDEDVKNAAAVLEKMKETENMKQTSLPPIETTQLPQEGSTNSDGFISRFPFMRRAYEQGKNSSPLIKYTTEMVSRISKPVIEKIPQLAQLDHYACRVSTTTTSYTPRWQQVLVGAGAAVGTARAVVSEESMKSLRYCLQWLQYATQHIEHQIAILRDIIFKLSNPSADGVMIQSSAPSTLAAIKKGIVDNLRKVIDIVSKYASKCLPDQAKQNVRSFILSLPTRWATINHSDFSATASPVSSPRLAPINTYPNHQTADYARRLLSLATESLDMLRRVGGIFGETVERAEAWVERLRAVGVASGGSSSMDDVQLDGMPPIGWPSQQNGEAYPYSQSSSISHPRSRRSSNSVRMNHRKYPRTTPLDDDEESIINNLSDDSDESEVENMRMEDNPLYRSNSVKSSPQHGGLSSGKKRKKSGKKDDKMDLY
ncbi:17289_t:CDS:2 [Acaulospora morrowiae]|uniref:17289_t:CDS:1 n=1 Tax=Acaulospora morrowiae TaxID=94023 RepID=A0A9N9ABX3_9GLOM|nr:17289_t:CDS:2 [Acaulospora morrowiae]